MFAANWKLLSLAFAVSQLVIPANNATAATPTPAQALSLTPIQSDVDFDRPAKDVQDKCIVKAESKNKMSGWVVFDPAGRYLRRFLDTNQDNKVDQWCYFKDGIEVYRDVDATYNGKADQYRWLGTAGIRWGLDKNEDGRIDTWKMISPEEVTAEVVAALRDRDEARFKRSLLTPDEIKRLGLSAEQSKELTDKVTSAAHKFTEFAQRQQIVQRESQWIHFGGSRPGVLAAGENGSTKDLIVYDNVTAVVETDGKHAQIALGSLIRVDENWRVIDLPKSLNAQANAASPGFFFHAALHRNVPDVARPETGVNETVQKLMTDFEAIERSLTTAGSAVQKSTLNQRRAELMEQIIAAVKAKEERANWIHQYADTLSASIQAGEYPEGIKQLGKFYENLSQQPTDDKTTAYVKYRYMNAAYTKSLQAPDTDFAKIQESWLKQLEEFVKDFPKADDAADAMMQLALAQEFAGKEDDAKKWYKRIVDDFESSPLATKAAGATKRLESVGKVVQLRGKSIDGKNVDLSAYSGKTVLIHYWATWCEPCKQEMQVLKDLQAKFGRQGFELIGVSLDNQRQSVVDYLGSARLSWPQLHEDGGLDSRYANELGILTLPAMILVDKQGKVISRNIHAGELDAELGKQLR